MSQIDLNKQDEQLRVEADKLLFEKGLMEILNKYGAVHVHGSYLLKLMTWRDLDIYLESEKFTVKNYFELGQEIAMAFNPLKMSYKDNRAGNFKSEPQGFYWGIKVNIFAQTTWKLDIWAMDKHECLEKLKIYQSLSSALTLENRNYILTIKDKLCTHPGYRDKITSLDIYQAVLFNNVKNINEFWQFIKDQKQ